MHIIFLAVLLVISDFFPVLDQCKTSTLDMEYESLIKLCQASSFSQSKTNTPPTRFYKRFAEPILLGPDPSVEGVGNELLKLLPQLPEAIRLCEVYREHGKYMQASIINRSVTQRLIHI